jgi:hypothetical protein
MPIVFVHGVNNRDGADYRAEQKARDGFLTEIVAPALGLAPDEVRIANPYWGGDGARFAWNMATLPDPDATAERFGGVAPDETFGSALAAVAHSRLDPELSLVDNARADLPGVVDALYAAAMGQPGSADEARALARSYVLAADYARANPGAAWLATAQESNFVDLLDYHAEQGGEESLGAGGVLGMVKEGWSRVVHALPDAASALAVRLARRSLNASITRFTGDCFVYLSRRGDKSEPGPIIQTVGDALRAAMAARTATDNKLVVIAHSFGGEIVYDILTHFDTGIEVDCLVTVGSQVGLFEEMKLYVSSQKDLPPDPPSGRLKRPANLQRWLNVYDTNDVVSYRVAPIFEGASDFVYDTGYQVPSAHGGYFLRPSFYRRLAARLKEG